MDFAKRQLLKYGWEEGKGLGKNENGISEALKPTLKFDTAGVGHDNSEQFAFNWWENVYNQAADNINVMKSDDGSVQVELNAEESVDITTKKYSTRHLKKKNNLEYGCFVKTSKLTPLGVVDHEDKVEVTTDDIVENIKVSNMTDEELFAACGGRTAHKGARHGLKLNGKLARIEEQEILLLQRMKQEANNLNSQENSSFLSEYDQKKKKSKKKRETELVPAVTNLKKRKHSLIDNKDSENNEEIDIETAQKRVEYYISKKERQRKKKLIKIQTKKISKITNMLENVSVSNRQENKDDGFEEKKTDEDDSPKKKHRKKKRRLNPEENSEKDDGFEEYISEVNEKLMYYKELRKDLQEQKRKGDESKISKMAEEFEKKL